MGIGIGIGLRVGLGLGLGLGIRVRVSVGAGLELGLGLGPCAYRAHSAVVKWSVSTARGALEERCTLPPTMGSGTSACGSALRAATPLTMASSCSCVMTARRAAGMARSPARPGRRNMKMAVTQ